jgi:hypothetical protein
MAGAGGEKRSSFLTNAVLLVVSIVLTTAIAEGVVRHIDGRPLLAFPLADPVGAQTVPSAVLDQVPLAAGVDRDWFFTDPPPLPNRGKPPADWVRLYDRLWETIPPESQFRPSDVFKAWNSVFAGLPCEHPFLRNAPGQLFLYDPADKQASPPYRFLPSETLPDRLVTNQIGWRGRPVQVPRGQRTIRIVFVGASTTVGGHYLPFSYPEFVDHWFNRWAEARKLDVRFEVLNAGRESVTSTDIAAIVHSEVLALQPDLVVYYEGGNQFRPASIVEGVPEGTSARPPAKEGPPPPDWLRTAARWSAIMARVQFALGATENKADGREWPKPDYRVVWPAGLDEMDPDLAHPNLPVSLNVIQRDLDRIRNDLTTVGGELAVSSFLWMVKDGMVLDPVRHRYMLEQLNVANYPFRYREMERLAKFQNRLLAKYAAVHGLTFVDLARYFPLDPNLFQDAVHMTYGGVRLQAWISFQQLVNLAERRLEDGSWPRVRDSEPPLPTFGFRHITFDCKAGTK